jgi:hypothetical protein
VLRLIAGSSDLVDFVGAGCRTMDSLVGHRLNATERLEAARDAFRTAVRHQEGER